MARYIAVHPVAFTEEQLKPLAREPLPEGDWEAPVREALLEIFERYAIPYETLYEVRRFDPAVGEMEAVPVEEKIPQPV
ncbi:MAG: hypothetical protein MUE82_07570 [Chloroflexi bacterium]|nr:hypothetical protein [Chloroflexota bacterium]